MAMSRVVCERMFRCLRSPPCFSPASRTFNIASRSTMPAVHVQARILRLAFNHTSTKHVKRLPQSVNIHVSSAFENTTSSRAVINEKQRTSSTRFVEVVPSPLEKIFKKSTPSSVYPYVQLMRLEKPTGVFLLLWPCYWSIAAATSAGVGPNLQTLTLFGLGAVLMRGAGCTVNDIYDRKFDAQVSRTANRPIASGKIKVKDAIVFLAGQLGASALILSTFDVNR